MHVWSPTILQTCVLISCYTSIAVCSMRFSTSARVLAARTGAAQFQEYAEENAGPRQPKNEQNVQIPNQRRFQKRLIIDTGNIDPDYYQGVVGRPGVDFPIMTGIPNTNFNCRQYGNGYFADLDTKCQVFHICDEGKKISFLCPNGTIFRQLDLICDWWFKVDCDAAPNHYAESSEMLSLAQKARLQSKHPVPQPIKSPEQFSLNIQRKHALLNNPAGPNLAALAFNRRMDTSVEESNESIDFEDISLKRNNVRRSNKVFRTIDGSSEETQATDETSSFTRAGKLLNGYNYPMPDKMFDTIEKNEGYEYEKPAKFITQNDKNQTLRTGKVLEGGSIGNQFGMRNSFPTDAKPFIARTTEVPTTITTTTLRKQTVKPTTASTINRGSTTYQTSTLNQKSSERKPLQMFEVRNVKPGATPAPENSNFPAYTTARKPSTKAKEKPFYTPTIPTLVNRGNPESTTPITPTLATASGAVEHAMEMMKTLKELEHAPENRPAVEVPPSSGPNVLHSLALYFANDSGKNTSTTTSPITTRLQTDKLDTEENRQTVSATLLTQRTLDRYQQLFNARDSSPEEDNLDLETRFAEDSGNDLEGQYSRHPIFGSSASPQIRELAQVFTHALSAYLQDPDSFRRILSEIRPKPPSKPITSNQIDNRANKFDDISTEEASYYSSRQQITPSPRAALREELEVLDFSDVTMPTTVKRETTVENSETTTEIPTTIAADLLKPTNKVKKTPASNLLSEELEKNALAYKDRQQKTFKSPVKEKLVKNELADEVNEELGTLKPPAFRVVESVEETEDKTDNSSYFPSLKAGNDKKSTPVPYGKDVKPANSTPITDTFPTALADTQAIPLRWGEELSTLTTTTDSSPTVYFELLPPHQGSRKQNLNNEEVLEDDEQLQRAQSQSIVASRNQVQNDQKAKTIYSFLNLDHELQQSSKATSSAVTPTSNPSTVKGHYITKQFGSESTTVSSDIATPSIPDTGKLSPNSKTTLSYTVFLDPLTINDGLMDSSEEEKSTTVLNAHTYLPRNPKASANSLFASTTPSTTLSTNAKIVQTRMGKSGIRTRTGEQESNENELMETMQRKANQMFGDLNDSEADHLMNVIKTADTNKSVRRLILLLIQTCDDDYNKTVEDSRKALLNALISMDSKENDSSEIRIVTNKSSKKSKSLKYTTTMSTPITTYRNVQFERLTGTTTGFNGRSGFDAAETTTVGFDELKSTNLDLAVETSTRIIDSRFNAEEIESTTQMNLYSEQFTTTNIPSTTIDIETTTAALTTTDLPTTTSAAAPVAFSQRISPTEQTSTVTARRSSRGKSSTPASVSNRVQKSLGSATDFLAESSRKQSSNNHHSDTRALEILRSLYSLASRWG
ncbi:mucin-2 [Uranotaenia lowii]|uniref:mucin-2 n=1 Tax=Uranotaenia lowii TaxID=190385 RepID=UPI0024790ACA|nr:mucin-2 [Uranotaenia lowii]